MGPRERERGRAGESARGKEGERDLGGSEKGEERGREGERERGREGERERRREGERGGGREGGLVPLNADVVGDSCLREVDGVSIAVARAGRVEQVTSSVERGHAAPWE